MYKIMQHKENQNGFSVSLVKYDDKGNLENGFTLISKPTHFDQHKYIQEFAQFTGYEVEQGF